MQQILHLLTRPLVILALGALAFLWLGSAAYLKWRPDAVVTNRHHDLVERISAKKFRKCAPLISETYLDQWGFNKDNVMLTLRDIGGQFLILHITMEDFTVTAEGTTATSSARLRFRGSGSGAAPLIVGEANRIRTPFLLHWRRENWRPWSWRIHRIENEGFPDFAGYQPGDFGAAVRNGAR